jgi:hypothetical protein
MLKSDTMTYNKYKSKLLSRAFKGSSQDQKDLYKGAMNRNVEFAMKSTYKRNKNEILQITESRKSTSKQFKENGWPKPKWSWFETARLKNLRSVNRSKRSYARRNKK